MKKTTQERLQEHFSKIRFILGDTRAKVLAEIAQAAETDVKNKRKYNPEYLQEQRNQMQITAAGRIASTKEKAKQRIDSEIAAARLELQSWMMQPAPTQLVAILQTYKDFGMLPSVTELKLLQDLSNGSYLGEKLVSTISDQIGVQSDFVSIDEINKTLSEVRSDAKAALDSYAGVQDSGHHYLVDQLGIQVSENDYKGFLRDFAQRFGEENHNDSLSRAESMIMDITNTDDAALTVSKRKEIDALFADCETDGDRLSTCINIMESGGSIADLMNVYDSDLTKRALSAIADQKRADAEKSMRSLTEMKEKASAAVQASTDAAQAADRAAGIYAV